MKKSSESHELQQSSHLLADQLIKKLDALSYRDYASQMQQFIASVASRMHKALWHDEQKPEDVFLQGDATNFKITGEERISSLFTPFIQKIIVAPDAKIITVGDVHGDIQTLVAILENLRESGYLDDRYTIVKDNFYIVFLGDYGNRRFHSVPVASLLFTLVTQNPDNIFLLRGNHEYASTNLFFHQNFENWLSQQPDPTVPPKTDTLLRELARRFAGYAYPDVLYWYDYLPLELYIGSNAQGLEQVQFVKFCHAGIELGLDVTEFLAAPEQCSFKKIMHLERPKLLQQALTAINNPELVEQVERVFNVLKTEKNHELLELYCNQQFVDFTQSQNPWHLRLGMQWNNFLTQDNDVGFAVSANGKNLYLGQELTRYFCQIAGRSTSVLRAIFRGHQHVDEIVEKTGLNSLMMTQITQGKGLVKQWDGLVYTLGASDCITGFQSFVMLVLDGDCSQWAVRHYYKKPEELDFSLKIFKFF